MIEIQKRKLNELTRLTGLIATDQLHVKRGNKDYYCLVSDLVGDGATYPDWYAKPGGWDNGSTVTFGLRLWKSLVDNNEVIPTEGASWTEVSPPGAEEGIFLFWNFAAHGGAFPVSTRATIYITEDEHGTIGEDADYVPQGAWMICLEAGADSFVDYAIKP